MSFHILILLLLSLLLLLLLLLLFCPVLYLVVNGVNFILREEVKNE